MLRVIRNKLYSILNIILFNLPEDYYRYKFFSRKIETITPTLYSRKILENFNQ